MPTTGALRACRPSSRRTGPCRRRTGRRRRPPPSSPGLWGVAVMPTMGALSGLPPWSRSTGGTEGEEAAVGGHLPVALACGGWRSCPRSGHRVASRPSSRRTGRCRRRTGRRRRPPPSSPCRGGGGHAHDRGVEWHPAHRAVELGGAEGEEAAVAGHLPVALACAGGGQAHHRGRRAPCRPSSRIRRHCRRRRPHRPPPPPSSPGWSRARRGRCGRGRVGVRRCRHHHGRGLRCGNTLTTQLTGLTAHAVQVGAGTATLTQVGPSASTGEVLQNNAGADPSYSTATYPNTTVASQLLYSSSTKGIAGLSTANSAVLVTKSFGVPGWLFKFNEWTT